MSPARLRSLPGLPRKLYRRLQALRQRREERRFQSRLRPDPDAPELLLSPHWDDAVLDCFTLLHSERELNIVNVFAGIPAPGKLTLTLTVAGSALGNKSTPNDRKEKMPSVTKNAINITANTGRSTQTSAIFIDGP